jgi:hypothetical protein
MSGRKKEKPVAKVPLHGTGQQVPIYGNLRNGYHADYTEPGRKTENEVVTEPRVGIGALIQSITGIFTRRRRRDD